MSFKTDRGSYPLTRMRRSRASDFPGVSMLRLACQLRILYCPFLWPREAKQCQPVESMPNINRLSVDLLVEEAREIADMGIPAIALFPVINSDKKSLHAEEAFNLIA